MRRKLMVFLAVATAAIALCVALFPLSSMAIWAFDIARGRQRVYQLEVGVGSEMPGVDWIDFAKCYSSHVDTLTIDIGDYYVSFSEALAADVMKSFAKVHNRRVVAYLEAHGATDCERGVDWSGAWREISEYLKTIHRYKAEIAYPGRNAGFDASLLLPDASRSSEAVDRACAIFRKHGIRSGTLQVVDSSNKNQLSDRRTCVVIGGVPRNSELHSD